MKIVVTKKNIINTKYNRDDYVYIYENFEIKRRKIVSIVYGNIANRLNRNRSKYAYELTSGELYSEQELFKTESELRERIFSNFCELLKKEDVINTVSKSPFIILEIKKLIADELYEEVKQELREKYTDSIKQKITSKILPDIVEEVKSDVSKKFIVTFNESADIFMA